MGPQLMCLFYRWRALAEQYLSLLEEREPLYHSYNSLWQEGVVLVSESLCSFVCTVMLYSRYDS